VIPPLKDPHDSEWKMSSLNQAVILAGGRGDRLKPLTDTVPKPMAPVNGRPFLDYLLQSLVQIGITRVLLLLGYRGDAIIDHYRHAEHRFIEIQFAMGAVEDQTARRILNAYDSLNDRFLLLYGDNYWPIELGGMLDLYASKKALVSTTVFRNANATWEYGKENNIEVGNDGFVKRYDKSRRSVGLNGVDIGYFIVDKRCLEKVKDAGNISFEEQVLPQLIAQKQLAAYVTDRQCYYITDLISLRSFERNVEKHDFKPLAHCQQMNRTFVLTPYECCNG